MRKIKRGFFSLFLIALMLFTGTVYSGHKKKNSIQNLSPKYKHWLDLVTYIIADSEKKSFLACSNDRDRDILIDLFWKMRDPTPGTKENEYKIEHIKRFNYANKRFKYGTSRPGWKTDMGRIHIILGKPISISKYEVDSIVHDTQIWSYYGDKRLHLPGHFYVMFYKRNGLGEYKIYDPVSDGTYALLIKTDKVSGSMSTASYRNAYNYLYDVHPVLAMASLSLVPDEEPSDYRPTFRSQTLLRDVYKAPLRKVNTKYARDFLNFKGFVKVNRTINYIDAKHKIHIFKDRTTGLNFLHFAILPAKVSAAYSEIKDKYFFHYKLSVILKKGKKNIFRYEKNFPVYIESESDLKAKFSNSVIISDAFPVPDGQYNLKVILNNTVNNELMYFEDKVVIRGESNNLPTISKPIITKNISEINRFVFLPYKFGNIEAVLNPNYNFGKKDKLYIIASLDRGAYKEKIKCTLNVYDIFNKEKYNKTFPINLNNRKINYFKHYLNTVPPGNYRIKISIKSDDNKILDVKRAEFSVNLTDYSKEPGNVQKLTSLERIYSFYHIISQEYKMIGRRDKELKYMVKAYKINSKSPIIIRDYSNLLLRKRDFNTVLQIIEGIKDDKNSTFIYHYIKGKALYLKGDLKSAIDEFEKANEKYDSDTSLLNILATAYVRIGMKEQGIRVFEASLKVNGNQKNIKRALSKLKSEK